VSLVPAARTTAELAPRETLDGVTDVPTAGKLSHWHVNHWHDNHWDTAPLLRRTRPISAKGSHP